MKQWLISCMTTLFLAGNAFGADAQFLSACQKLSGEQEIQVQVQAVQVKASEVRPIADIAQLGAPGSHQRDAVIFGVTIAQPVFALNYTFDTLTDPKTGAICVMPSVAVELAYSPLTVVTAAELNDDQCMRSAALAHEREHVEVYQSHLAAVQPGLLSAIQSAIKGQVLTRSPEMTEQQLSQQLDDRLMPIIRAHYRAVDAKHALVDSTEHLETFRLACSGRINNLAYRIIQARSI